MSEELVGVLDIDWVKYTAASVGETRTVLVKHLPTGREKEFTNRTEFWGRGKKTTGWLGEQNEIRIEKGLEPFTADEFEITDVQTPEPIENVLHTVKLMVETALNESGATSYKAILGKGDSFRVERSTLMEYKGNRKDSLKPLLLDDVIEYIIKKYNPIIVEDIEADDMCVMECYGKDNHFIIGVDKDHYAQPVKFYNVNKPEEGIVDGNQFGKLWIDEKGKVRGVGRMFLYFQIASGDSADNYKANCFSNTKWGDKSAYNALVDCTNDKEAWEALVKIYKKLYPEPKIVVGWRGDEIDIDWLYVLEENFTMARMLRYDGDEILVKDILDKYGIDYADSQTN